MSSELITTTQNRRVFPVRHAEPSWYALYTCANQEKLVSRRLEQRGIENYLPVYETIRRRSDRRVKLSLPLFPGYLFVRIRLAERLRVVEVPRVVRLVGSDAVPLVVQDREIELLQKGLCVQTHAEPCTYLKKGCQVRILHGPFAGTEGVLLKRRQGFRVVISIDTIMRSFTVEVGEEDVERIASRQDPKPRVCHLSA